MGCSSKVVYFLLPLLIVFSLNLEEVKADCGSKGISCLNETSYQTCWYFLWMVQYSSEIYTCEAGTTCDQNDGDDKCISNVTTVLPTTTSEATTTTTVASTTTARPDSCGSKRIHCFNETNYRSCMEFFGVYLYSGDYQTCGSGLTCDENSGSTNCVDYTATTFSPAGATEETTTVVPTTTTTEAATTTTAPSTTTTEPSTTTSVTTKTPEPSTTPAPTTTVAVITTTEAVTSPTTCNQDGARWPSAACNQYYQCYLSLWNYYVVARNCTSGTRFNSTSRNCENDSTCVV